MFRERKLNQPKLSYQRDAYLVGWRPVGQNVIRCFPYVFNKFKIRRHNHPLCERGDLE